jgi:type III restriction enzyme
VDSVEKGDFKFIVLGKDVGFKFPPKIAFGDFGTQLNRADGKYLERFLYEFANAADFNYLEKNVAWFLDGHERLLFWFRNIVSRNYSIQGWKKHRIWPDFIFTSVEKEAGNKVETVYVVETKGPHLMGAEDTEYKKRIFDICNNLSGKRVWTELGFDIDVSEIRFEVLPQSEWKRLLNSYLT